MSHETPPHQGKPHWTGMSLALLVIGTLILVTCGLCTAMLITSFPPAALFFLLLAALPTAVGGVLVWGAFKSRRSSVITTTSTSGDIPPERGKPARAQVNFPQLVIGLAVLIAPVLYALLVMDEAFGTIAAYIRGDGGSHETTLILALMILLMVGVPMALGLWLVYSALKPPRYP